MIGLLCLHSEVSGCQLPCHSELTDGGCWEGCFGLEFSGTAHRLVLLSFSNKLSGNWIGGKKNQVRS